MQLALDVGFVISLLLLTLGLERVLLPPQERERIQAFLEELTVKVDDLSAATIAGQLGNLETIRLRAFASYFWFCVIIVVTLTLSGIITRAFAVPTAVRDMQLARAVMCGISLMLLSRWPTPQLLARVFGSAPSRKRLSIIAVTAFFGGSAVLLTAMLLTQRLVLGQVQLTQPPTADPWTASGLLELAFWPAYVLMWLFVAPLTLASAAFERPGFVRRVVVPFAGSLWRLVEYERGAFSAFILVAAFVLGAVKLLYGQ